MADASPSAKPPDPKNALEAGSGKAQSSEGISLQAFVASLAVAAAVFGVEFFLFLLIKGKFTRIYQPRTYLVPQRERTNAPPSGIIRWALPVFKTSNSEFIQKCGLDAYFFLRYLRMLLKIFVPLAFVILPVLVPLNRQGGKNTDGFNVTGLDQLAWGNVRPDQTQRYWAHLVLAVLVVVYVCFTFFDELRGYVRLRQAYLTSPQHRLRASATTVLVTSIPRKWLSVEALDGLYDVFPGGIRNIWLNRNFDALGEKVKMRNKLALALESAETVLIKKAKKEHMKQVQAGAKKGGQALTRSEKAEQKKRADADGISMAQGRGNAAGDPHQVRHTLHSRDGEQIAEDPQSSVGEQFPYAGRSSDETQADHDHRGLEDGPRADVEDLIPVDGASESRPRIESREDDGKLRSGWVPWSKDRRIKTNDNPSPRPTMKTQDGKSLDSYRPTSPIPPGGLRDQSPSGPKKGDDEDGEKYPPAFDKDFEADNYGEPLWKKWVKEKDRDTMRVPLFQKSWVPSIPFVGKKVDTIYYCRKELARLNVEIEQDQQHPEDFPLMNSAFIQFNHQVAAHMACQAVSHHIPKQMGPRLVEISPDDVLWDNMAVKWWERYLRGTLVVVIVIGMIIGWATPVAFTGLLSQLNSLTDTYPWLDWINELPSQVLGIIQGVLPPIMLAILLAVLPLILRILARQGGVQTGMGVELSVQNFYFAFLFVQVTLVVSIAAGITTIIQQIFNDPASIPGLLAENLPAASNYFFSYMILQAFSVSAGALVQIGGLISWFILAPMLDNTARKKWARQTNLPQMQWGTFFPIYTNLACIGLIYSVVSPLIMIFNIITFSLFWVVYRYNTLYVTKFRFDTGGLLFPRAINQLFTGLYVMELCLIGLFFLVRDSQGRAACSPQGIVMIVVAALTVLFQYLLNEAFSPLFRYLPITLEDEAVERDEAFARAQATRLTDEERDGDDLQDILAERERRERHEGHAAEELEMAEIEARKHSRIDAKHLDPRNLVPKGRKSWADRSRNEHPKDFGHYPKRPQDSRTTSNDHVAHREKDVEAQRQHPIGDALFSGIHDEIHDLSPAERDKLVQRAFQHEALRAKRPVIWLPRDDLGISDDEIYRIQTFSKHIWVSNEYTGLDSKARVVYRRSPPDFSEIDLIEL
ncbi:MAG: hypothetical protein M1833_003446 [Piccolia ochrophora]|nr:MAG: hypothetical protein M1833_003446 [Piccolia ochrophora]